MWTYVNIFDTLTYILQKISFFAKNVSFLFVQKISLFLLVPKISLFLFVHKNQSPSSCAKILTLSYCIVQNICLFIFGKNQPLSSCAKNLPLSSGGKNLPLFFWCQKSASFSCAKNQPLSFCAKLFCTRSCPHYSP